LTDAKVGHFLGISGGWKMEERNMQIDANVIKTIQEEIEHSLCAVKELEADAEKKGIPLTLSGARYRIYETDTTPIGDPRPR